MFYREVERLRAQVKKLEETRVQNNHNNKKTASSNANFISPPLTPDRPRGLHNDTQILGSYGRSAEERELVESIGLHNIDDISEYRQMTLHGPISMAFFLKRMSNFLSVSLQKPHFEISLYAISISLSADDAFDSADIPRQQQDYLLDLFWQGYHCIYPIIDEAAFREHYETLWTNGTSRQPSPLVDIIMALCLQFGSSFIARDDNSSPHPGEDDAAVAGLAFYQRCYAHLLNTIESPSVVTVQCYIFSIIYLLNASLTTTAQVLTATAIRVAYIIGLHQEPPEHLSGAEKELRRRMWWTFYLLDTQICMEQGGPWMMQISHSSCRLADHSPITAQSYSPNFISPSPDFTWLSYQTHALRLANTVRAVHAAFYEHCNNVVSKINTPNFYEDGQAREDCARYLIDCMKKLQIWAQNLPGGYKTPRRSNGEAFATDKSLLDIDRLTPLWLQRQRFLLELEYHNYAMNLYRSFICFSPNPSTVTAISDGHAISALNHAITITNISYQVLTETEVLHGWYRAFQWLRNAMLTMVGYACAYPVCPPTPSARKAILTAISALELFSSNFAAAEHAVKLGNDLNKESEYIIKRFHASLTGRRLSSLDSNKQQQQQPISPPLTIPTSKATQEPFLDNTSMYAHISMDTGPSRPSTAGAGLEFLAWVGNDALSNQNINDIWSQGPNFNFSSDLGNPTEVIR